MIIVFLNNKLITCDTIVPFLFELKQKQTNQVIELFCFNESTYNAIMQNTVLAEAINGFGILRLFGSKTNSFSDQVKGKIFAVSNLFRLCMLVIFRSVYIIHFKALNYWPLKLLFILNRKRVVLFQPTIAGSTELENKVDNIAKKRRIPARPVGSVLIGFHKNWSAFQSISQPNTTKLLISATFKRRVWMEHLRRHGSDHLKSIGIRPGERFITFILSSMCTNSWLKNPDDFPILFDETLQILSEVCPELPIVIKPHPATLPENIELQKIIMKKHGKLKLISTQINPMLLASQSEFFISNCYSSTFVMAKESNVSTIEYTDPCNTILKNTKGGSMRPDMVDYFIRRNPRKLRAVLDQLLNSSAGKKREAITDKDQDDYGVALELFAP